MESAEDARRERRGLGRGLGALLGTASPTLDPAGPAPSERPGGADPILLTPAAIEPNPFQPRVLFDAVKLAELADSIRTHGLLQPLLVRRHGPGYQLISGERRWRAAQQAGLAELPVVVKALDDRQMLEVALVENVQREEITPLEAAAGYRRLAEEFGLTQEEIARRVGKSRSAVANAVRLFNLPDAIQASLADGRITEGHARALLGIADPGSRDRTWRSLLSSGGSVRDAEQAARRSRTPAASPPPPRRDPHLSEVESRLRGALGTKVEIRAAPGGRGTLSIEFYDDDDLNRILELLAC